MKKIWFLSFKVFARPAANSSDARITTLAPWTSAYSQVKCHSYTKWIDSTKIWWIWFVHMKPMTLHCSICKVEMEWNVSSKAWPVWRPAPTKPSSKALNDSSRNGLKTNTSTTHLNQKIACKWHQNQKIYQHCTECRILIVDSRAFDEIKGCFVSSVESCAPKAKEMVSSIFQLIHDETKC